MAWLNRAYKAFLCVFQVRSLMLPVKLGSVIAATTPIIVNDSNISAIVKAKHCPRARMPIMAVDSVDPPPPRLTGPYYKGFQLLIFSCIPPDLLVHLNFKLCFLICQYKQKAPAFLQELF